eukprot:3517281-Pyramimonas_sp.AAC.1
MKGVGGEDEEGEEEEVNFVGCRREGGHWAITMCDHRARYALVRLLQDGEGQGGGRGGGGG